MHGTRPGEVIWESVCEPCCTCIHVQCLPIMGIICGSCCEKALAHYWLLAVSMWERKTNRINMYAPLVSLHGLLVLTQNNLFSLAYSQNLIAVVAQIFAGSRIIRTGGSALEKN